MIKNTKKYSFQADRKHGISKSLLVIDDLIASDSGVYTAIVEDSTTGHKIEEKKRILELIDNFIKNSSKSRYSAKSK